MHMGIQPREQLLRKRRWTWLAVLCALCIAGTTGTGWAEKKPPAKPIDLNAATVEQLQQLPGVGPATAKAIVQFRQKSGPFKRVEDLLAIPRITKQKLEKIRPYVTTGPAGAGTKKP
jgi:competence ComEA-like helix-hairpin-helix protein